MRSSSTVPVRLCMPRLFASAARASRSPSPMPRASSARLEQVLSKRVHPCLTLGFAEPHEQLCALGRGHARAGPEQLDRAAVPRAASSGASSPRAASPARTAAVRPRSASPASIQCRASSPRRCASVTASASSAAAARRCSGGAAPGRACRPGPRGSRRGRRRTGRARRAPRRRALPPGAVERIQQRLFGDTRHVREHVDVEARADHAGREQRRRRLRTGPLEALDRKRPHRRGNARSAPQGPGRAHPSRRGPAAAPWRTGRCPPSRDEPCGRRRPRPRRRAARGRPRPARDVVLGQRRHARVRLSGSRSRSPSELAAEADAGPCPCPCRSPPRAGARPGPRSSRSSRANVARSAQWMSSRTSASARAPQRAFTSATDRGTQPQALGVRVGGARSVAVPEPVRGVPGASRASSPPWTSACRAEKLGAGRLRPARRAR